MLENFIAGIQNMSLWEIFPWALTFSSLTGNVFVIKKNVLGQWIWLVANLGWVCYDLYIGAMAQACLFGVYMALCVWGIVIWTREAKMAKASS
jgi:hypothetical protein